MKIEYTQVFGFETAFRGKRNPMNSWHKSDSFIDTQFELNENSNIEGFVLGEADKKLSQSLIVGGTEHCKFLRQIQVWADIDMPRYWLQEFDTYKFCEKNSCSTIHKLFNKQAPITLDMFVVCSEDTDIAQSLIDRLNKIRGIWLTSTSQKEKDYCLLRAKRILMEGFLQLRTVNTNYAELRNIYHQRKNHRLKEEWQDVFCKWVESLPYSKELITYTEKELEEAKDNSNNTVKLSDGTLCIQGASGNKIVINKYGVDLRQSPDSSISIESLSNSNNSPNEIREFVNKIIKETNKKESDTYLLISIGLMHNIKLDEMREIYSKYGLKALTNKIRKVSSLPKS
ncbi:MULTISPECIES: hypothetical protein [unclassified Clostridium]|uniref:hypothetical protein n=1 Tax=unclassified Clostridium TaxID=2614128 RepID=UPI0025BEBBB0|nr:MULTISPECIES: hypothetical protein [unclassified Clostridium]